MRKRRIENPWIAAVLAWFLATVLVAGIFILMWTVQDQPINWGMIGKSSAIVAPLALWRAWRDRRRED